MGALPKQRISRHRQGNRRRHHLHRAAPLVACQNCGEMRRPHHVCPSCGFYRGRQVIVDRRARPPGRVANRVGRGAVGALGRRRVWTWRGRFVSAATTGRPVPDSCDSTATETAMRLRGDHRLGDGGPRARADQRRPRADGRDHRRVDRLPHRHPGAADRRPERLDHLARASPPPARRSTRAGLTADEIDLIVVATCTPDQFLVSQACLVQAELGGNAGAFDLGAACSGFVYALSVGTQFVQTGIYDRVLVIGVDTLTRFVDYTDRSTCILFGDGAGAVVLEATDRAARAALDRARRRRRRPQAPLHPRLGRASCRSRPSIFPGVPALPPDERQRGLPVRGPRHGRRGGRGGRQGRADASPTSTC